MVTEESSRRETKVTMTAPLMLNGESDVDYKAPNLLQRILSLLKNVRPGSDLTHLQLPPLFNLPKSQLQCFGESVCCVQSDLLSKCTNPDQTPVDRFKSVVAWSISTTRPAVFGLAPYNPILGETHHVSRGNLNVLLEQVSHHPPVSALHATDDKEKIELIWCQHPVPKFHGTSIPTEVKGKRTLKLLTYGETYVMNSPNLLIRILPVPGIDWVGDVRVQCQETGLGAELHYRSNSFIGLGRNYRSIRGKIVDLSSSQTLYEIEGHWDSTVRIKDISSGKLSVLYNAEEVISRLKTPQVRDPEGISPVESTAVWNKLSKSILNRDWELARETKKAIEEKQRELRKERIAKNETWEPKYFSLSFSKEGGWTCMPKQDSVPPAPIFVPFS